MKIKIVVWAPNKNISVYADAETKDFTIGVQKINRDVELFVRNAIAIVSSWPDSLVDDSKCDGVKYKIAYFDGVNTRQIVGLNKKPDNFPELISLIEQFNSKTEINNLKQKFLQTIKAEIGLL